MIDDAIVRRAFEEEKQSNPKLYEVRLVTIDDWEEFERIHALDHPRSHFCDRICYYVVTPDHWDKIEFGFRSRALSGEEIASRVRAAMSSLAQKETS